MKKIALLVVCGAVGVACAQTVQSTGLEIGWAEADITPPTTKRIPLCGQYYQRLADEANPYHSRIKFVALAMRRGGDYVLMGSIDNVTTWQPFVERVRARVKELAPEIAVEHVYMGAIHTHSAPAIRPSGTPRAEEMERKQPDVWGPNEYSDFALDLVAGAYVRAWKGLKPGGVCRAFGTARVGHCRLARYADGSTEMYGDTSRPDFVGMLEGEDDGVGMLFTVDASGRKTGLVLNVACPSQVMEANYQVSSDFAGATREKLKKLYGEDFGMLYQIGAAGCQSPRDLVRRGRTEPDGWHDDMVQLLSDRLVGCVTSAKPGPMSRDAVLKHENRTVTVPMRRVTEAEVAAAKKELDALQAKWPGDSAWNDFLAKVHENEAKGGPGPYDSKLHPYAVMDVDKAVLARAAEQDTVKEYSFEMHVTRIGDVAMVTCPFELYLAYGQVIKARSAAVQTFIVTKCGSGGYLPTAVSENSVGYSGGINVGKVGHEGGYRFCDEAVGSIARMFGAEGCRLAE
ncbi:MAG: hypothetical protein IKF72_08020 [Kiritimatiellae bacterium]|nr:hypothetical protein [Kiritimatiellia bacterium]